MKSHPIDLKHILTQFYDIQVQDLGKSTHGYSNENFIIKSKLGRSYIVRISPFYRIQHLWLEHHVLNRLQNLSLDFCVPRINATISGNFFVRIGDMALTVFDLIPGIQASKFPRSDRDMKVFSQNLGAGVGHLHNFLSKIETPQTKFTHERLIVSYSDKFKTYEICDIHTDNEWRRLLMNENSLIMEELQRYLRYYSDFGPPVSFVHSDIREENILVKRNEITAILDFDDTFVGDQAFDLAAMLVEIYCNKDEVSQKVSDLVDIEGFAEFAHQYFEVRRIEEDRDWFMHRVVALLNLQALQVLSIVGRDPDFDERARTKNVIWYSNFIRTMKMKKSLEWIRSEIA